MDESKLQTYLAKGITARITYVGMYLIRIIYSFGDDQQAGSSVLVPAPAVVELKLR